MINYTCNTRPYFNRPGLEASLDVAGIAMIVLTTTTHKLTYKRTYSEFSLYVLI